MILFSYIMNLRGIAVAVWTKKEIFLTTLFPPAKPPQTLDSGFGGKELSTTATQVRRAQAGSSNFIAMAIGKTSNSRIISYTRFDQT